MCFTGMMKVSAHRQSEKYMLTHIECEPQKQGDIYHLKGDNTLTGNTLVWSIPVIERVQTVYIYVYKS